ncbi:hypothetical protein C8J56DRAFT_122743 [Mycena floridula]|nr:hypothetical protein C8J56DRAFT_122743 [Mycena floridula]
MNDTKKAFDFMGELKKLNESGASDRRSFVEQLENAFKTPAKIDLGLLRVTDGLLGIPVPLNSYVLCLLSLTIVSFRLRARGVPPVPALKDDSVMKSILAKATEISVEPSLDSDLSSKRRARDNSNNPNYSDMTRHLRHSSGLSFVGFNSFEEVRCGFECHESRAPFYLPTAQRMNHGRQESMFRIASISSFGHVMNPGVPDPLEYEMPSLPSFLQHGWEYQEYLLCLPVIQPLGILGYSSAVGY